MVRGVGGWGLGLLPMRYWGDFEGIVVGWGGVAGGRGWLAAVGAGSRERELGSGERCDVSVGGEDVAGGGPTVEDTDDVASGFADDTGGGVPELPAETFRLCPG